jgi:hypothetical protein
VPHLQFRALVELHKKCQQAFLAPLPGRKPISFIYR